jgi:DNA polymerase-4
MKEKMKSILHVDMDAFFASVEERDNPSLKGKPVVVGAGVRGVVSAANYVARSFGIHSAMPVTQAKRLAPHAIFIPPRHDRYSEVSDRVMEIFDSFTPHVEPISLDEAFLDVTGGQKLLGSAFEIGQAIRKKVFEEEQITCSVGISTTKFIAKLASAYCKPNGIIEIPQEKVLDFLHPLPVSKMWGVGEKTEQELFSLGLRTIGDIAHTPEITLIRALGKANGQTLHHLAWGRDNRDVVATEADKSISSAETFSYDIDDTEIILGELLRLTHRSAFRMRRRNFATSTISIKVRFADFRTISKSKTLPIPIKTSSDIYEVVKMLYLSLHLDRARIRLVSVGLEGLVEVDNLPEQMELGSRDKGWSEATTAMDQVFEKFGKNALRPARLVESQEAKSDLPKPHEGTGGPEKG